MKGSQKQISWAEDIKHNITNYLRNYANDNLDEKCIAKTEEIIADVETWESASEVITVFRTVNNYLLYADEMSDMEKFKNIVFSYQNRDWVQNKTSKCC